MEELFNKYLPILIHIFELMGILILTLGVFTAFYHYILKRFFKRDAVIIKNMDELIILASVFIIRIIMTFVLEKEMKIEKSKKDSN